MDIEKDKSTICPNCAAENFPVGDAWFRMMDDGGAIRCGQCNEPLPDDPRSDEQTGDGYLIRFLLIAACLFGVVYLLNSYLDVLSLKRDSGNIVYTTALFLFVSFAMAYGKIRKTLKYLSVWVGIFTVLFVGYTYRYELSGIKNRVLAEIIPVKGVQNANDSISFPVSSDGHFYIRALVDETPIIFLVDTGASDIVLSPNDAEKLGYHMTDIKFNRIYETANGVVRGGSVQLMDFKIGPIHLPQIGASVNEAEMSRSLLGMAFFNKLKSFEIQNQRLTLYWNP